jgi:hypothetical protein
MREITIEYYLNKLNNDTDENKLKCSCSRVSTRINQIEEAVQINDNTVEEERKRRLKPPSNLGKKVNPVKNEEKQRNKQLLNELHTIYGQDFVELIRKLSMEWNADKNINKTEEPICEMKTKKKYQRILNHRD